jgi:hypothetical protein
MPTLVQSIQLQDTNQNMLQHYKLSYWVKLTAVMDNQGINYIAVLSES